MLVNKQEKWEQLKGGKRTLELLNFQAKILDFKISIILEICTVLFNCNVSMYLLGGSKLDGKRGAKNLLTSFIASPAEHAPTLTK